MAIDQAVINLKEAAEYLGVSQATIRNWNRLNLINPHSIKPLNFRFSEVQRVLNGIVSGEIEKLNTRANKSHSSSSVRTVHHLSNKKIGEIVYDIVSIHEENGFQLQETLFNLALVQAWQHGILQNLTFQELNGNLENFLWKNKKYQNIMSDWLQALGNNKPRIPPQFKTIETEIFNQDLIGILYQALISENKRSKIGSYFTPDQIVENSFTTHSNNEIKFLDPCCGTGTYIIHAIRRLNISPENVFGFDIDPIALRIAKINLLREFQYQDIPINLFEKNSITELLTGTLDSDTEHLSEYFNLIATNPPWGAYERYAKSVNTNSAITSGEAFSLIIEKSLRLTVDGGKLSFLLPESILKTSAHKDIRKLLLEQTHLNRIVSLGRPFPGVLSKVVRLDLTKVSTPDKQHIITFEGFGKEHQISQSRFSDNRDLVFDVDIDKVDEIVLFHIYDQDIQYLGEKSRWALGVVTGNNSEIISKSEDKGMIGIITGSDVHNYFLDQPTSYLFYDAAKFQQSPDRSIFDESEKLIYRFISKKLTFALDTDQYVTLNSANILIPAVDGLSIRSTLAFLNSDLFQYVSSKKFSTYKVLKSNLKALPFPSLSPDQNHQLGQLVSKRMQGDDSVSDDINTFVYSSFNLPAQMITHIKQEIR